MTEAGPRRLDYTVSAADGGARLDQWLAARLTDVSRTRVKALVDEGRVRVDGRASKAGHRLRPGERVEVEIPAPSGGELLPEPIALDVVYEDEDVLVIDKPAGMVTHPGAGRPTGTLAAAAIAHAPSMAAVGSPRRPGIVHRLDKGTSGLIVLARTQRAYDALTAQLARRSVTRRYLCVVHGVPDRPEGVIDKPIARDPRSRVRMAVAPPGKGKRAVTRFRVLERFAAAALVECRLETGRTHQIRVHLSSIGHPLLGDSTYGQGGRRAPGRAADRATRRPGRRHTSARGGPRGSADPDLGALMHGFEGVALHAAGLAFIHPASGQPMEFSSPLPYRIEGLLSLLRHKSG